MNTKNLLHVFSLFSIIFFSLAWASHQVQAQGGGLHRLAADSFNFDGSESETDVTAVANCSSTPCVPGTPDGVSVYSKTVDIPDDDNVAYVSFSAQADTHGGSALWMSCRINGVFCNPGIGLGGAGPAGWVSLLKLPAANGGSSNCSGGGAADCHDNGIHYNWIIPINEDGDNRIELRLASSIAGQPVFLERANVLIDSSELDDDRHPRSKPRGKTKKN